MLELDTFRQQVKTIKQQHPDWGYDRISKELKCSRSKVRRAIVWLNKTQSDFQTTNVVNYNDRADSPLLRSDVLKQIRKKRGASKQEISDTLNIPENLTKSVIEYLRHHDGYNIAKIGGTYQIVSTISPQEPLRLEALMGKSYSFGVISDTHLCNKHSRLDVLEAAYDLFKKRKITQVLHAGNFIDGQFKYNMYELEAHGVHDQAQYVADNFPQRKGIKTYFITGDCHEGWYQSKEGLKIGWYIQNWCEECGRNDLIHIGHIEQDILLNRPEGDTRIRVIHPGGGCPYALSYPSQKMVESFQGGEKPQVLIMGHYHKFDVNYVREVLCLQPGCVQDQTPFMRKQKLAAHVGFCVMTIGARIDGTIGSANIEWFPFYDRMYHQKLNNFKLD